MNGPTIGRPHGLTDREWGEMCEAWRQAGGKVVLHGGGESHCVGVTGFTWSIRRGIAYRLALPDTPDPIPDDLPPGSVAVDWFEHPAWVVRGGQANALNADEWECRGYNRNPSWGPASLGWGWLPEALVAVRRKPEPPSPVTEDVPLAQVVGRTLPGRPRPVALVNADQLYPGRWSWSIGRSDADGVAVFAPLPVNPDGTVTVLAEDGAR